MIDFSELDIRSIDEGNITSDKVQNEIFRLFDSFLIDNKNIMELIANRLSNRITKIFKRKQESLWEPKLLRKINKLSHKLSNYWLIKITKMIRKCEPKWLKQ